MRVSRHAAVPALLLAAAAALMILGAARGEVGDVLSKGVNLCLECVGIG